MSIIRTADEEAELQCGHGPKTVENGVTLRTQLRNYQCVTIAFNAATAQRPWRTFRDRTHLVGLAFTGGFNAATVQRPWRTTGVSCVVRGERTASMRPRPKDRGELWHRVV